MSHTTSKKRKNSSPATHRLEEKESRDGRRVFALTYGPGCSYIIDDSFKYYAYRDEAGELVIVAPVEPLSTRAETAIRKHAQDLTTTQKIRGADALFLSACPQRIDLSEARRRLQSIPPCKELSIRLDYLFDYPDNIPILHIYKKDRWWGPDRYYEAIVLSLNRGSQSLSTIALKPTADPSVLEITSMTRKEEEGKGYNKMLRSAAIYAAFALPGITHLKSVAIHPASAWSLINYYEVENKQGVPKESIRTFFEGHGTMDLMVPLNETNEAKALAEYGKCTTKGGRFTRKHRSKRAE